MIQQILTIARNTFIECIRQPIFVVLIFVASLTLVLNPMLSAYTLEDDNKLMIELGLSTLFLAGLLLSAFSATGVLANEIENKTVLTVVSKPVNRPVFVMGKYVGVSAAIALAFWILSMIFLLTIRHKVMQTASDGFDGPVLLFGFGSCLLAILIATVGNYLYRWVFTSSVILWMAALMTLGFLLVLTLSKPIAAIPGSGWHPQNPLVEFSVAGSFPGGQIFLGLAMVFQAVLILVAIALAVSTRLGQVMTLTICSAAFMLGLVSEYIHNSFTNPDRLLVTRIIAKTFYTIVPNLQILWPGEALSLSNPIPPNHLALTSGYTAMYVGAILCLAVALFQTREVG